MGRLVTGPADAALDQRLSDELDAFNLVAAGAGGQREFTVKAEDEQGALVAGLSGWTWGTSAGIAMLWVREDARGSGWGARLVAAAEDVARQRGCERLHVSSLTFQAPDFYVRQGFQEVSRTPSLPLVGQADVHLVKSLGRSGTGDGRAPVP